MENLSKDVAFKHRSKRGARFSQLKTVGRHFQAEGRACTKEGHGWGKNLRFREACDLGVMTKRQKELSCGWKGRPEADHARTCGPG